MSYFTTCALDTEGKVYCWGADYFGSLGDGGPVSSTLTGELPVEVDTSGVLAGKTIVHIGVGMASVCAMDSDGQVYCWGTNSNGELGNGTTEHASSPTAVVMDGDLSGKTPAKLSVGYSHACVNTTEGKVYCWGSNAFGALGSGEGDSTSVSQTYETEPTAVETAGTVMDGKVITRIDTGLYYTCAIDDSKYVYCWGWDAYGMLGNGNATYSQNGFMIEPNYVVIGANSPTSGTQTTVLSADPAANITNYDTLYIEQRVGSVYFPDANHPETNGTASYYLKQIIT